MTRVVFLGGLGRSGTTLMERLLAEFPGVCGLGEVVHLWERGVLRNERCGCGRSFHACTFWRTVGEVAFGGWDSLDATQLLELKATVDRTRFIPWLAGRRLPSGIHDSVQRYVDLYQRLYAAASEVSGCEVIVDSSKHASLAYCLRWAGSVDLRVLHVVRDSRAVAYSWTKSVPRPEATGTYMARFSPLNTALHWDAQNVAFALLGRLGVPTRQLWHEDLVRSPAETLRDVADFAALRGDAASLGFLAGRYATLSPAHTVSGNPVRFQNGWIELRPDESWRSLLPTRHRVAVSALTLPFSTGSMTKGWGNNAPCGR